jgi:hypothetical protein
MSAQHFKVDLRRYRPGICVGFEKLIVECPVCGEGAYSEGYSGGIRYVHSGTLSNGPDGLRWKRDLVCRKGKLAHPFDQEEDGHG